MSSEVQTQETAKTKNKKRHGGWLLIILIIVLMLFLLSSIFLGSRLYEMTTRDKYTVDLGVGMEGEIELFRIEYSNAEGEVIVQGLNADNVVAPGTTVNYDVRLRNNDEVVIDFLMEPSVTFLTGEEVPVEFKMMDDYGNYLLGDETSWVRSDSVNGLSHKGQIHPGEVFTYHVTWQWVFEESDDQNAYDTYLANLDGEVVPGVSVGIETEAMATPHVTTKDVSHVTHLRGESFGCCWCCWLVWLLLLVLLVVLFFQWRLRRKFNKQTKIMQEYEQVLQNHGLMIDGKLIAK